MVLTKKYTNNNFLGYFSAILIGLLYALVPILPILSFWHTTLTAHYFLLICFIPFVYDMKLKHTIILFGIIGFILGAIHGYLLVICGIILTFYSIMMFVKTKDYKYFLNILALSIPAYRHSY